LSNEEVSVEHLSELERELLVLDASYYELDELLEQLGVETEMAAESAPATRSAAVAVIC